MQYIWFIYLYIDIGMCHREERDIVKAMFPSSSPVTGSLLLSPLPNQLLIPHKPPESFLSLHPHEHLLSYP